MESLKDVASKAELITFDCYGTLIDWNSGIRGVLQRVIQDCGAAGRVNVDDVLAEYQVTEASVEAATYLPYRRVLAQTLTRLAARFELVLQPQHRDLLAETLPDWRPFPDTNAALGRLKLRYRLGILSNIDRDLFAGTARHFNVAFDLVVTAEDARAYKPAHPHFLRAREWLEKGSWHGLPAHEFTGRMPVPPEPGGSLLHVAQSAYHDGIPTHQLGIPWVWINRTGTADRHGAKPVAEFPDLASFVAALLGNAETPNAR
jgi:2-haloalkanoic acid dehalogenase type II